jgi:high-affinity iron transporter
VSLVYRVSHTAFSLDFAGRGGLIENEFQNPSYMFMCPRRLLSLLAMARLAVALLCLVALQPAVTCADEARPSDESVQRLLTLLAAVAAEYREGVQNGAVVRPIEYDEAKTFLADGRQRFSGMAANLSPPAGEVGGLFAEARTLVDEKAPVETVAAKVADLRQRIMQLTGVSAQVYPPAAPSAARGRGLFEQYCVTCHGEHGDGKGPSAAGLNPPPANFTDPQFIRGETPYDFYHVISLGKSNTAMPAWDGVLSVQDRWDLVSHLWSLAPGTDGIADGQGIYLAQCAGCHGPIGDGHGPYSATLVKAAPDLSQPQALAKRTDQELFACATSGVAGTPMPAFARTLRDDERWKAVAFLRALSLGGAAPQAGGASAGGSSPRRLAGLLRLLGQSYAHAGTGSELTNPVGYDEADALVPQATALADSRVQELASTAPDAAATIRADMRIVAEQIRQRAPAAAVDTTLAALTALVDAQSSQLAPAAPGPAAVPNEVDSALTEAGRLLDAAVAAYGRGAGESAGMVSDAYLQFEPLEQRLGATAPDLKAHVEEGFLHLRQLLRAPGKDAETQATAAAIHADLDAVGRALQPHSSPYALFIESATIILREGLEIVLVIGALIAYVVKTRNPAMLRAVYAGTALGIVASLATAFVMGEVLHLHPGSSDTLEGITMLLAAAVLFWVSYWLISKTEADKWQRFIRGKVQSALTGGRGVALASAAFLAVYREGFETVLFYQALYASAPGAAVTVTAGFATGTIVLLVVYALLWRFEVQIPIRQFFFVTGLLLYCMAAIFAGQGIHELQEAGIVGVTAVAWIPAIPLLGLYPSLQSLAAQALFLTLLGYASAVTVLRARPVPLLEDDGAVVELRALRTAIERLREELELMRRTEAVAPAATIGERVEGLLVTVEELAGHVRLKPPINGRPGNGGRGRNR